MMNPRTGEQRPTEEQTLLENAKRFLDSEDYENAFLRYKDLLTRFPNNRDAQAGLDVLYFTLGIECDEYKSVDPSLSDALNDADTFETSVKKIAFALQESGRIPIGNFNVDYFETCRLALLKQNEYASLTDKPIIYFLDTQLLLKKESFNCTIDYTSVDLKKWRAYRLRSIFLEASIHLRKGNKNEAKRRYLDVIDIITSAKIQVKETRRNKEEVSRAALTLHRKDISLPPPNIPGTVVQIMLHSRYLLEAYLGYIQLLSTEAEKTTYILETIESPSLSDEIRIELLFQLAQPTFIREIKENIDKTIGHLFGHKPNLFHQAAVRFADLMVQSGEYLLAKKYYEDALLPPSFSEEKYDEVKQPVTLKLLFVDHFLKRHKDVDTRLARILTWPLTSYSLVTLGHFYEQREDQKMALDMFERAFRYCRYCVSDDASDSVIPLLPWELEPKHQKQVVDKLNAHQVDILTALFSQFLKNKCSRSRIQQYEDYLSTFSPLTVTLCTEVARFYVFVNEKEHAIDYYEKGLEIDPNDMTLLLEISGLYYSMNNLTGKILTYAYRMRQISRLSPVVNELIGDVYCKSCDFNEAISYFSLALRHASTPKLQASLALKLSRCTLGLNQYNSVERYFQQYEQYEQLCQTQDSQALLDQADLYKQHRPLRKQSIALCLRVLEIERIDIFDTSPSAKIKTCFHGHDQEKLKTSSCAFILLIESAIAEKEYKLAEVLLPLLSKGYPSASSLAIRLRINMAMNRGRYDEAIEAMKVLSKNKDMLPEKFQDEMVIFQAEIFYKRKQYTALEKHITVSGQCTPVESDEKKYMRLQLNVIQLNALLVQHKHDACERLFMSIHPSDVTDEIRCIQIETYLAQADRSFQKGEMETANRMMEKSQMIQRELTTQSSRVHYVRGLLSFNAYSVEPDNIEKAIGHLVSATEEDNVYCLAYDLLATLYLKMDCKTEAIRCFKQFIDSEQASWKTYLSLGNASVDVSMTSALQAYQNALLYAPEEEKIPIALLIANTYLTMKNYSLARKEFNKLVASTKPPKDKKSPVIYSAHYVAVITGLAKVSFNELLGKGEETDKKAAAQTDKKAAVKQERERLLRETANRLDQLKIEFTRDNAEDYFSLIMLNAHVLQVQKEFEKAHALIILIQDSPQFSEKDQYIKFKIEQAMQNDLSYQAMEKKHQEGDYFGFLERIQPLEQHLDQLPYYLLLLLADTYWQLLKNPIQEDKGMDEYINKGHAVANHLLSKYSNVKTVTRMKADLYFLQGNFKESFVFYQQLPKRCDYDGEFYKRYARTAYECQSMTEAYVMYRAAVEKGMVLNDDEQLHLARLASTRSIQSYEEIYAYYTVYYAAKETTLILGEASADITDHLNFLRSMYHLNSDDMGPYLANIEPLLAQPSLLRNADHVMLTMVYLKLKNYTKAMTHYEQSGDGSFPSDLLFSLGILYYNQSRFKEANACCQRAKAQMPESSLLKEHYILLCQISLRLNDSSNAVNYYELMTNTVEFGDFSPEELMQLATIYLAEKHYSKVRDVIERYDHFNYKNSYDSLTMTATLALKERDDEWAFEQFKRAFLLQPNDQHPDHLRDAAYSCLYILNMDEAIAYALDAKKRYQDRAMSMPQDLSYILCAAHWMSQQHQKAATYLYELFSFSAVEERFIDSFIGILAHLSFADELSVKSRVFQCYVKIREQNDLFIQRIIERLLSNNSKNSLAYLLKSWTKTSSPDSLKLMLVGLKEAYSLAISSDLLSEPENIQLDLSNLLTQFIKLKENVETGDLVQYLSNFTDLTQNNPCFQAVYQTLQSNLNRTHNDAIVVMAQTRGRSHFLFERYTHGVWTESTLLVYLQELTRELSQADKNNSVFSEQLSTASVGFSRSLFILAQNVTQHQLMNAASSRLIVDFFKKWEAQAINRLYEFNPLSFSLALHAIIKLNITCSNYFIDQFLNAARSRFQDFNAVNLYYFLRNFTTIQSRVSIRLAIVVIAEWEIHALERAGEFNSQQLVKIEKIYSILCRPLPYKLSLPRNVWGRDRFFNQQEVFLSDAESSRYNPNPVF